MAINQISLPNNSGYETDYVYKVLDMCGNPMNWVEVNESFPSWQFV